MSTYRVVFQLARPTIEFHEAVLRNVRNVVAELDDVTICLIAHGEGIGLATGATVDPSAVRELLDAGADIVACRNTLRRKHIPEADVLPNVRLVPAGLAELVRLQHDGWAYIHP